MDHNEQIKILAQMHGFDLGHLKEIGGASLLAILERYDAKDIEVRVLQGQLEDAKKAILDRRPPLIIKHEPDKRGGPYTSSAERDKRGNRGHGSVVTVPPTTIENAPTETPTETPTKTPTDGI